MSDRSRYWSHGVDVQVQFTKEYPAGDGVAGIPGYTIPGEPDAGTPEFIVRNSHGATIIQDGNARGQSCNWFHLPIPTATQLIDKDVDVWNAFLMANVNGQATITNVHIYMGDSNIYRRDGLTWSDQTLNETFDVPNVRCTAPLLMCVKVYFENGGRVTFVGAGAQIVGPEEHG